MYDVIVIGGGPAGIMAAIAASKKHKVLLIEKNNALGKKLLLTGGGRCNVTNKNSVEHIIANLIGNGKFLYSAFSKFNNQDIINFFSSINIQLKEEDNGRMFPTTNSSKTILDALQKELIKNKVEIQHNSRVIDFIVENNTIIGIILNTGKVIKAKNYIIATGGKSFPHTGSNGDGYKLALKANHTITKLYPSEVPLTSSEEFIKNESLKGLSLSNIKLSVLNGKNKIMVTHQSDMIFTHFGISGPAVLRCSSFVLKQDSKIVNLLLDALPNISKTELLQIIKKDPKKTLKSILKKYLPQRYIDFICSSYSNTIISQISDNYLNNLINNIKGFTFTVNGSLPIERAFVTAGGVNLKEIEPQTMKSKLINNLYFAGEVIDIHGYTGGYNITAALVSGHLAGESIK